MSEELVSQRTEEARDELRLAHRALLRAIGVTFSSGLAVAASALGAPGLFWMFGIVAVSGLVATRSAVRDAAGARRRLREAKNPLLLASARSLSPRRRGSRAASS